MQNLNEKDERSIRRSLKEETRIKNAIILQNACNRANNVRNRI